MLGALTMLAWYIPVDQVIATRGIVTSRASTIVVQPLDTSIVRSIEVHEGQRVHAGDVLARLDPTFATADLATLSAQLTGLEAETARLQAESKGREFNSSGTAADWALQAAIHAHRIAEFKSKTDSYQHKADELRSVISRAESDAAAYRERLGFAQSIEDMRTQLAGMAIGSKLQLLVAKDSRAEMARALADAEQNAQAARRNLSGVEADRDAFVQGWHADVAQKFAESSHRLSDVREQLNKAKLRRALVELRSEREAVVQSIGKVSLGSVLQSGQQLMTLVPADSPLEVEANVFGRDIGFVHIGDQVSVKFDTFPFAQYGLAQGTLTMISPTSFTAQDEARNPTSKAPVGPDGEPFYRARINLDKIALHDVPHGFQVAPGMPVTADIKVGKRTVLDYLLGLVLPIARDAMREPS
jgi:HlyD family secretion protein